MAPAQGSLVSEVELNLLPTVSRPVYLGVGLPSAHDQIFVYCLTIAGFLMWGGSIVFSFCWALPAQPFSDLSPMGLLSIFYCLYF
jgi:hypothetical protein